MDSWDTIWQKIIRDNKIKEEYKRAFLLNLFQKTCAKMNNDISYKNHIMVLFRQSYNKQNTTKSIIEHEHGFSLTDNDSEIMYKWFDAYIKKSNKRLPIPHSTKDALYNSQRGLCMICGQPLGSDWKIIHIDHIIPWILVGDELDNNYQLLCSTCNQCKNSKTDFIFKSLLSLV